MPLSSSSYVEETEVVGWDSTWGQYGMSGLLDWNLGVLDKSDNVFRTISKSVKSYNIEGSKRSASLSPNDFWHATRNKRIFFKHKNCDIWGRWLMACGGMLPDSIAVEYATKNLMALLLTNWQYFTLANNLTIAVFGHWLTVRAWLLF